MITDRQGNALHNATPEAAALFDQALEAFNFYRGDPLALTDAATAAAPQCAMAPLLKAWLMGLATEPAAAAEARAILVQVAQMPLDARARAHAAALQLLLAGDWGAAAVALDHHNASKPHDLLALQCGHLMDFYRASARGLRDRIARVLPHWSAQVPGHGVLLGMHAFGLEECGDYAHAEDAGREAIDRDARDCWAHHAVAHVMEMQGRAQDGIGWMLAREPHWSGEDNFFRVHNWWHLALYHLDLGDAARVLALYDGPIRSGRSMVALDMVDASALLWRLHLAGHEVGERWNELAEAWELHADGTLYPFNDWHAVMAWLGAGREAQVERVREALTTAAGNATATGAWARDTALPLVAGFTAFWRGDYRGAVEQLHPVRFIANSFGGSHAQRDIIDWTLTEAALRGGMNDFAHALAHERLALKRHSPINQAFLSQASAPAARSVA